MVELLSESEGTPTTYPDAPAGLSTAATALSAAMIWRRIETWVRHRWETRTVVWRVRGPGEWEPPLQPATITATKVWRDGAWSDTTLEAAPGGYLLEDETYQITATVGDTDDPPASVLEAFRRLAEYLAEETVAPAGASSVSWSYGETGSMEVRQAPTWKARAMHLSGAADLLREWRRSC
jgi:hypothetical protein